MNPCIRMKFWPFLYEELSRGHAAASQSSWAQGFWRSHSRKWIFVNKGVWALRGRLQLKSWFRLRAARWVGSGIWWARLLDAALVWRSRHVALERRLFEAGLGTSWLGIFWKWPGSQNAAASKQMQLTQWYFPYTGHTMINCSPC